MTSAEAVGGAVGLGPTAVTVSPSAAARVVPPAEG